MQKTKMRIVTLGDPYTRATCSQHIAQRHYPNAHYLGAETFESGCDLLIGGAADALLVPAAYPSLPQFLMRRDLCATECFLDVIPELVFVMVDAEVQDIETVFYHPATESLLDQIPRPFKQSQRVRSNEEAVLLMLKNGPTAAAITNMLVAAQTGVAVLAVLREAKAMGWILFQRMEGINAAA